MNIEKIIKGAAARFITRTQALRKLQLKLNEFRRLCILKGIFPKEPNRYFKGVNKTYYSLKDIRFLANEKLINKFREIKAYSKKITKARKKNEKFDEYDDEIKELLNHEENKITLEKVKSLENIAINIKNCIEFVINNVEIFPNWKWVNENWDTLRTFQFIHTYLTTYNLDSRNYLKNQEGKIPLSWYSLYIINNLKKIK